MSDQAKEVYVGNLEYDVTEDDLKAFFEENGLQCKALKIIKDKYSGRSKGFGFVEMDSDESIEKAISSLDGQDLKGRKLKISKAKKSS